MKRTKCRSIFNGRSFLKIYIFFLNGKYYGDPLDNMVFNCLEKWPFFNENVHADPFPNDERRETKENVHSRIYFE